MSGMNARRDPDSVLGAWLDEGPTELPDATRRAILTALRTTPQARRGLHAPWKLGPVSTLARTAAAVVAIAVVGFGALAVLSARIGPGVQPSPSGPPSSPVIPLPTLDATFVSPQYGYSIRYPSSWTVRLGAGPWPIGTNLTPGESISDAILSPVGPHVMRISTASVALPSGWTVDDFRRFATPFPLDPRPCTPVAPIRGPVTFAYERSPGASLEQLPAVVSINGCASIAGLGGNIYDLEVIAGSRGYEFTLDGEISTDEVQAWLATITLEPASAPAGSQAPTPTASQ
jgi:hypothetical protein